MDEGQIIRITSGREEKGATGTERRTRQEEQGDENREKEEDRSGRSAGARVSR